MPIRLGGVAEGIAEYLIYAFVGMTLAVAALLILIIITTFSIVGVWSVTLWISFRTAMFIITEIFLALRHGIWDPQLWPPSSKIDRREYRRRQSIRNDSLDTASRPYAKPRSRRQSHGRMDSVTSTSIATPASGTLSRSGTIASLASDQDRDFGDMGGWAGPNEDSEALYMARHTPAFSGPLSSYTQSPTQQTPTRSRSGSQDVSPMMSRSASRAPITSEYSGFQNEMRPRSMSNNQPSRQEVHTPYGPQTPSREGISDFGSGSSTSFSAGGSTTPTLHESSSQVSLNDRQPRSRRSSVHRRSANLSPTSLGIVPEGRPVGDEGTPVGSPPTDEDGLKALRDIMRSETVR
ncbi:uncharacterized protein CLAFUR5_02437 [Fulvia fulva]|uniref:Uncharacterized protein n=1 Tax=Passalora fulva TaxID=5499 RepID=A0A9Q8P580_PASFU|nr:uncharacterized protein CLAFUR5_02437 [Fulvia fulva]UJO13487.1 hypothetical protein CLAFUR5_02437 [Fulvia fulva]